MLNLNCSCKKYFSLLFVLNKWSREKMYEEYNTYNLFMQISKIQWNQ